MTTRTEDSKTFHMLINNQRRSLKGSPQDLHVENEIPTGKENILHGFKSHFANQLAIPTHDNTYNYKPNIEQEMDTITELVKCVDIQLPSKREVYKAMININKGKTADEFDLTIENFLYGGDKVLDCTHKIILAIFKSEMVPDIPKKGLLAPVYKIKSYILNINNYRGITVLPVLFESILKHRIKPNTNVTHNADLQKTVF
ncbi:unnamed protein product [Mytilus coruscus]|uniref:Reverse transcriptase domain-containing protein n=1 Tax=Mytilus coruscus TaxID=42192 RepID=A0A6J8D3M1_MYTCO|nr:unnamed protein product [Mytilus coruscus]